ncbi:MULTISPECIES: flagellar assembly peptidoglycan hydrolase FlgJ [unclassified Massilia]|uniref:flagellar assembly peptidoglycan hydrolase FlgJ n=1 Tax=unclassified Massilia TaxID=2609279 RepID=UPI00177E0162|nr:MULTISPECIES: flagellar assembly peptidoglycan hydrolase FlgJ [unclassified Massilia]MBD8528815.1 flagellar assembly peptidoglycan hydrolase FlgJ [Massilia sp. CFBP 13647]MBD8673456.1 flagellar assembly peptidoglycan hydrolase FlgJ [Massilia sp. CFBP 13721]
MTPSRTDVGSSFALDTQGLGNLKRSAKAGSAEATRGAAQQFEALFINQMMKSMRDATPSEGLMDNQQTKMFTSMLDQQLSQNMSKRGMGLADVLVRQLSAQNDAKALAIGGADGAAGTNGAASMIDIPMLQKQSAPLKGLEGAAQTNGLSASGRTQAPHVRAFQDKLGSHAAEAEAVTGVPAKFMLGQAALETGWGKRMIRNSDGSNSNNLFGIKAGPNWKGKVATAVTTEYVNGHARQKVEKFRAYDTPADSFKDYARMIANNPRYEKVLDHAGDASAFAHGLQRAGYATDPQYGAKLSKIIKHSLA